MFSFKFAWKYLRYELTATHENGHGIHSPFVFNFVRNVLEDDFQYPEYQEVESEKRRLLKSSEQIKITDYGAGSRFTNSNLRKISQLARTASKAQKHGRLLFRLARYFQVKSVLELGTSLGISTLYLSEASPEAEIYTIEGCPETAKIAQKSFKNLKASNIHLKIGRFEELLPQVLPLHAKWDLIFFDGNHQEEPTLDYFRRCLPFAHNETVFIFDDIHWSEGMESAWNQIVKHPQVRATVDLFFMGIVFFRKEMQQQNFAIKF